MTFTKDPVFRKDPNAVLDYKLDYANTRNGGAVKNWLEVGETISTHTVIAPDGITVDSSSLTDNASSVTVWLSGGTVLISYLITVRIVTNLNRTDDRSFVVRVREF